jgi:aminopeptidase N
MPLATYFVTLVAGPYHSVHGEHDGIPLGLHCRASLAEHLDRDAGELLAVTAASFDRLHELFGVRYPFGKYDQAFVPELSAGAMENPGCVTFSDDYVFRSAVTDAQRESRAVTVAHEMAHMWFGDLVTMRWWDDLWLNESFAEYLGVRVTAEATRFSGAWTTFAIKRKAWGYAADQRPSTHPVAPTDVADTTLALLNFDGISYAKGAAALRQLAAWVGDDAFLAGLRAHIAAHRFGNATLADLLAAIAAASGRDLDDWARRWLRTSEVDTLRPRLRLDSPGRYAAVDVAQSAPGPQRPHRIGIGLYDGGTRRTRVEVDLAGSGDTPVPDLTGQAAADLLLLNDGDLSYAKVRLDPGAWDRLAELLPTVDDPVTRGLLWVAAWDAVRDAERPIQDVVALLAAALPAEPEVSIVEHVLETARDAVDRYLDTAERAAALATVREAAGRLLAGAAPGGSHQLAGARGVAASSVDVTELRGWLSGNGVPPGLAVDADLRWRILCRLVVLDAAGLDEIRAEAATDRTATGQRWAATCRAAVPDGTAKAQAWTVVTEDTALSGRLLVATAAGFWQPEQGDLCSSYVDRYFAEMPAMARIRTPYVVERLAAAAFPRYAVHPRTRAGARALLARTDIDPALRRAVVDEDDDLRRALAARTARGDTAG